MDYIKNLQGVLDYIEAHITEELSLNQIAQVSCYSPFHFHRLFHGIVGTSVMDYVRKRRLQRAGDELLGNTQRIVDVAMKYNFSSSEHFCRLFKKYTGMSPGEYRSNSVRFPWFEQIKIGLPKNLDGLTLTPTYIRLDAFQVGGLIVEGNLSSVVPKAIGLWRQFVSRFGEIPSPIEPHIQYGINEIIQSAQELMFRYMTCVKIHSLDELPKGFIGKYIPASDYAVFHYEGEPNRIGEVYDAIYGEWLPSSGYALGGNDDFERYECSGGDNDPEKMICDVYIAIQPKHKGVI